MADWPISRNTIGDDYLSDDEARHRYQEEYAATLFDRARRVAKDDGQVSQTPQEAALELIGMAEEALSSPGCRIPEPVRIYLHESLQAILGGKDADVALGIRYTKGRRPRDDATVSTILAHVELGIRRGLSPVEDRCLGVLDRRCPSKPVVPEKCRHFATASKHYVLWELQVRNPISTLVRNKPCLAVGRGILVPPTRPYLLPLDAGCYVPPCFRLPDPSHSRLRQRGCPALHAA